MSDSRSLFDLWRSAEQKASLLFAYWSNALNAGDVSEPKLRDKLMAQRDVAHEAFQSAMDDAAAKTSALYHRRIQAPSQGLEVISGNVAANDDPASHSPSPP